MQSSPKLLVISARWAPHVSGSTVLMSNLFSSYPGACRALGGIPAAAHVDEGFQPPCPLEVYRPPLLSWDGRIYERALVKLLPLLVNWLVKRIRRLQPDVIMGNYPNSVFMIAAFQAAKKTKTPFIAYMHDLWIENRDESRFDYALSRRWEERILTESNRLLCITEEQRDYYRQRVGVEGEVIHHSIRPEDLADLPQRANPLEEREPSLLFVGGVSRDMNMDALQVVGKSFDHLPDDVRFVLCSPLNKEQLAERGITAPRLERYYLPRKEVQELQGKSAVLLAPLSHKNGSELEVRTVFSTKLLEYLVSGRPILVFAPEDSYHARSAREGNWGYVVDRDDPEALAEGIRTLLNDRELCDSLVRGAVEEARRRSAERVAGKLYDVVKNVARG